MHSDKRMWYWHISFHQNHNITLLISIHQLNKKFHSILDIWYAFREIRLIYMRNDRDRKIFKNSFSDYWLLLCIFVDFHSNHRVKNTFFTKTIPHKKNVNEINQQAKHISLPYLCVLRFHLHWFEVHYHKSITKYRPTNWLTQYLLNLPQKRKKNTSAKYLFNPLKMLKRDT